MICSTGTGVPTSTTAGHDLIITFKTIAWASARRHIPPRNLDMSSAPLKKRDWLLLSFGGLLTLVGVILSLEGLWLVVVGGSWYYMLAGVGMAVSGVMWMRGRPTAVYWYAAVLIGTFLWAGWESGLDYWRWIPRVDVVLVAAFVLALLMPRLEGGVFSRRLSYSLATLFGAVILAGAALAFVPHGFTQEAAIPPQGSPIFATDTGSGDASNPGNDDWYAYGRSLAAQRFSPLTQITPENVGKLQVAWTFRTGDIPKKGWGLENTPIKIGDTVYTCTPHNIIIALDAGNGTEKWRYDPHVPDKAIPYTAACRGLTYHDGRTNANASSVGDTSRNGTSCAARIIEGTLDGRVIAVDARTGAPCADFGKGGQVSIMDNIGPSWPGYVSINSPPVVVRNTIVVGHQVLDGSRAYGPSGVIKAFDVYTGKLKWAWDAARPYTATPLTGTATYQPGSPNVWTIFTGDDALGMIYLPVANASGDYYSSERSPAVNEFSSSLTALNVETGLPVWKFQSAHKDVWDYDPGSQPTLIDYPSKGGAIPAIIFPTKQGEMYIFDRRNGKPLFGVEERPVPGGGVEPSERSKTQPYSLFAHLRKPDLTSADMWGMTPFDQIVCRVQFAKASYKGQYTPLEAGRHSIMYPGYNGGSDWGGVAIDPTRGLLIANYNDMPNYNILVPRAKVNKLGWKPHDQIPYDAPAKAEGDGAPQVGLPYGVSVNAGWRLPFTGLLCKEPPYGGIRAIDLRTGRTLWDRPLGTARNNGPFGLPTGLSFEIGTPNNGGSVVTASGLTFIAAATDGLIRAINNRNGKTVWSAALPAGGQATPMIYGYRGRQYLVITAGGHHFMETPPGDYVIAYALPS